MGSGRILEPAVSAECESKGLNTGVEELDFEGRIYDRTILPD